MKKLILIAAATLLSFGANAADYNLIQVISSNPFAPSGSDLCPSSGAAGAACAGTASFTSTADGSAVSVTGLSYAFASANASFVYGPGEWSTNFGTAQDVIKGAETCTGGCDDLLGDWISGTMFHDIAPDGTVLDSGGTSDITVSINADGNLSILRTSAFPVAFEIAPGVFFGATAGNDFIFELAAPIPVPAAVWLFGSALGLLGWVRRRAA